jgi:hypothetical protein
MGTVIAFKPRMSHVDDARRMRYTQRSNAILRQEFPEYDKATLDRCADKLARLRLLIEEGLPT